MEYLELIICELLLLVFIYLFLLALNIFAVKISGWKSITKIYIQKIEQTAKTFRMRRAFLGKGSFPLGLDIKIGSAGITLLVPWVFRFGLPPIHILWDDLHPIGRCNGPIKKNEFIKFSLKFSKETQLWLRARVFSKAHKYTPEGMIRTFRTLKYVKK